MLELLGWWSWSPMAGVCMLGSSKSPSAELLAQQQVQLSGPEGKPSTVEVAGEWPSKKSPNHYPMGLRSQVNQSELSNTLGWYLLLLLLARRRKMVPRPL